MILALDEAKMASLEGEVPVGCVIINRSTREIVSSSHNMMQKGKNANLHAEIIAINDACKKTNNKNLSDYDIYITLEPCTMCASAISNARLGRVYYGASDVKQGAVENGVRFFASSSCQHRPEIYPDIQKESSEKIMTDFFKQLRES
ncbi:MAG: nucleoside deaminase [Rickettsiaceae bacterium]|nr:nucleoside deaminase [Rickettsiaceae bacterium]